MIFKDLPDTASDEDDFKFEEIFKKKVKVKNGDNKSISLCQHQQIQIHVFRVPMITVTNPPKIALENICHAKVQDEN